MASSGRSRRTLFGPPCGRAHCTDWARPPAGNLATRIEVKMAGSNFARRISSPPDGPGWMPAAAPIRSPPWCARRRILPSSTRETRSTGRKTTTHRIVKAAYTALTFLGEPVTFVTERQLAEGSAAPVRQLSCRRRPCHRCDRRGPGPDSSPKGGKLIALGDGNLGHDEYDRRAPVARSRSSRCRCRPAATIASSFASSRRWPVSWAVRQRFSTAKTGERIFGVEYRVVSDQGRTYLSALNQLNCASGAAGPAGAGAARAICFPGISWTRAAAPRTDDPRIARPGPILNLLNFGELRP